MIKYLRFLFVYSILFFGLNTALFAQDETKSAKAQDSVLLVQQNQGKALLRKADSVKMADSVQTAIILAEIEKLKSTDASEREKLQARLDSIKNVKIERQKIIKAQVDSLRELTVGVPVIFHADTMFFLYAKLGPFGPSLRAQNLVDKLNRILDLGKIDSTSFHVIASEDSYDILYEDVILMSVTQRDAFFVDRDAEILANDLVQKILKSALKYQSDTGLFQILFRLLKLALVIIFLILIIRYMNKFFTMMNKKLILKGGKYLTGIRFKTYEFLSVEKETQFVRWLLKIIKWFIIILAVYLALPIVFSIFPSTKGIATTLINFILTPVKHFLHAFVNYISELITIVVIVVITRYVIKALTYMADEVALGRLRIQNFYPEWAKPTLTLLKIVIYAFSFIIIFPLLPGSGSPAFQGVSVFLGVLISLGSSSAISNIIAGLVITYMRAFKIGDRVKIGDTTGDVLGKTMLVTHMRTIKNEDITIPNSAVLNGSTINYSSSAKTLGLILNTTITIGYDVPWKKVHEMMISAAVKTEHIKKDPKPFVLQTSLDDFYVSYQINAYTEKAEISARIYSELHANIQDAFNEAGVEIMSPHYRAARDGNMVTIPAEYLPKDHEVPSFQFSMKNQGKSENTPEKKPTQAKKTDAESDVKEEQDGI